MFFQDQLDLLARERYPTAQLVRLVSLVSHYGRLPLIAGRMSYSYPPMFRFCYVI